MSYLGIINGDCDNILPQMIKAGITFDLILTDPPYNIGKDFCNDTDSYGLDTYIQKTFRRINFCKNLLTDNGSIVWFGIHDYICFIQCMMYELGLYYRRLNIWHYDNGMSRMKNSPVTTYEPFLWFSKSDKEWTYNADDVRVPYKSTERIKSPVYKKNAKGEKVAWTPNPLGALRGDIWEFPVLAGKLYEKERTEHPTQKPESLITELIKAFCPKDSEGRYSGYILDPFLGSGTLGVCCEKLNLQGHRIKWCGIELEEKWCDVARKRLDFKEGLLSILENN